MTMIEPSTREFSDPVAWGASICDEVKRVLAQGHEELARAYADLGGAVDRRTAEKILTAGAGHFLLAGVDLMPVIDTRSGKRKMLILEVNSAPGFIYCTPEKDVMTYGYGPVIDLLLDHVPREAWGSVVHFSEGKTPAEDRGFQYCLERRLGVNVPILRPTDFLSEAAHYDGDGRMFWEGRPVSGGIRYLHDRPWSLIPPDAKGTFVNPTSVDLCGGRDKLMADVAFSSFRFQDKRIPVSTPLCIHAGSPGQLRDIIARSPSPLVVKKRHLNSGLGVYFIVNKDCSRLDEIADADFPLVVQEMIPAPGMLNAGEGNLRQAGVTIGNDSYACDLRIVLASFANGFRPLMIYARRARLPFRTLAEPVGPESLDDTLKVNIAVKTENGFVFETERLILPDNYGWELLGLSEDEIKAAIVESALAVAAVDSLCMERRGCFGSMMEKIQASSPHAGDRRR